jgi:alpha-1,3/alpha-1,6-mannosyltransferase
MPDDRSATIMSPARRSLRIAFIHPVLGIGGAERLVVDAATHLQSVGHHVMLFTSHHDPHRGFPETADGTLQVRVQGNFLPRHIGQRLRAPLIIARMSYAALALGRAGPFDLIFCDLVAHAIPLLRRVGRAPIIFYCHFPDQLLAPAGGRLYRAYRQPIDRLEAYGMRLADRILVNSAFTASVFRRTFPTLCSVPLDVVFPGVDVGEQCDRAESAASSGARNVDILSINRYVPAKNMGLAIEALAHVRTQLPAATFANVRLTIAGSYDGASSEQRQTLRDLHARAQRLGLLEQVVFLRSISDLERRRLLSTCRCVVYTPLAEHFGYGPLEAMASGRPVIAVNNGGPLETIRNAQTGFLCAPTPDAFAAALCPLITDAGLAQRMGAAGRHHVAANFSRAAFGAHLESIVRDVVAAPPRR